MSERSEYLLALIAGAALQLSETEAWSASSPHEVGAWALEYMLKVGMPVSAQTVRGAKEIHEALRRHSSASIEPAERARLESVVSLLRGESAKPQVSDARVGQRTDEVLDLLERTLASAD